ncbi:hypothetical protein LTR10_016917 [Elasticomyces elasticus]|uniref:Flavin reductase like domain-containing protein n=1 Tax=Exophiala sideris TaxID=1016849 RepID=A0ABR0JEQ9_9EURO|nr:hypothetical protein LTR10_016917 [Elasticomyces elasticus]KAK5025171.1 hypothetical protein LTS07_008022 [Exophiala sideris]KAK5029282.1 hypothetical protein LTR13_008819 [Exophiala sideris]KAK5063230.1 hypothetical protein LTR69_003936 [Exophiala sideris]KAK5178946.1 hypothetical protein LTR44_008435 [Eurotiomycetes sp. CCFEE 6388]
MSHQEISPAILYWGTPVTLISTTNPDASDDQIDAVNALARTTGTDPVPAGKAPRGYTFVKDKFGCAGLTPLPSKHVACPGIKECPVIMEAELVVSHNMYRGRAVEGLVLAIEVRILRVSIHEELRLAGHRNRVDADKWKPMIMMFCDFYGLKPGKLVHSKLAECEEEMYRGLTETTGELEDDVVDNDEDEHVIGLVASNNQ